MKNSTAILLAAGSSRRMGTQKLLLPFRHSTLIESAARNILRSRVEHTMVVLGRDSEKVRQALSHLPVDFVYNEHHESGMFSSVIAGLRHIAKNADPLLFFLGDQPEIPPRVINRLLESYEKEGAGIVIPVQRQRRGHPLLVNRTISRHIPGLDPQQGLRSLLPLFQDQILEVEVDAPGILMDIDTPEEYQQAIKTERI